jgi:hypothetical protein
MFRAFHPKHLILLNLWPWQVMRRVGPWSLHLPEACATLMKLEVAVEPPGGLARKAWMIKGLPDPRSRT